MLEILKKFDNKKVLLKVDNGQTLVCKIKVISNEVIETETNHDTYYIHPSSVRFVKEFKE